MVIMRKTEVIIKEIKDLVVTKGYIYALCMIIFEDFSISPEELHKIDCMKRLSTKEASLLLGFLIQNEINFSIPDTPNDLIQLKQKTYDLMEELHGSFWNPFFDELQIKSQPEYKKENIRAEQKELFGKGNMLIEPIFYSGTGVYDFQYLDVLDKKYKYDRDWLIGKKNFDIEQTKSILVQIKNILHEKSKKVNLCGLKERMPQMIEEMKKKHPNEDWEKHAKETLPIMEFHQYVELFLESATNEDNPSGENDRENGWNSFYKGIIELFIIRKSDFDSKLNIDSFLNNFSISAKRNLNSEFKIVGDYNQIISHPIIKLDEERYFIPITFLLFESIYESPFHWMQGDKSYRGKLGKNRGKVGEEITYDLLCKVFGDKRTFKSVGINLKKGQDATDIDVLCILGSKALCIQVKSKKLTLLSRTGNDEQLEIDFQGAVQDAYQQGLTSREEILKRGAKYIDGNGNEIQLSDEIDDVYLMGVTTENYPALTHQSNVMLNKQDGDPFPIVLTIFDLELLIHYLDDPYDFLYYIKQRISLMDYFKADEEIVFLGYHLDQKLCKIPNSDVAQICTDFGQLIDRNYYPLKAGLNVSDDGDTIKNRWENHDFDQLCNQLKLLGPVFTRAQYPFPTKS